MFDVNKAVKKSRLSEAAILRLKKAIKSDYPGDALLYELHLIRALRPAKRYATRLKRLSISKN